MKHVRMKELDAKRRRIARQDRDRQRGRLGPGRFDGIVNLVVQETRRAFDEKMIGSIFGLEGEFLHDLRSGLCLQRWRWADSDAMAREILAEAFKRLRAHRPSKEEGQPGWVIADNITTEITRCARSDCGKPLPEGRPKFCCDQCRRIHHSRVARRDQMVADQVAKRAAGWI